MCHLVLFIWFGKNCHPVTIIWNVTVISVNLAIFSNFFKRQWCPQARTSGHRPITADQCPKDKCQNWTNDLLFCYLNGQCPIVLCLARTHHKLSSHKFNLVVKINHNSPTTLPLLLSFYMGVITAMVYLITTELLLATLTLIFFVIMATFLT